MEDLLWLEVVGLEDGRLKEEIVERVEVANNVDDMLAVVICVDVGDCSNIVLCPGAGPEQTSPFGQQPIIPFDARPQYSLRRVVVIN